MKPAIEATGPQCVGRGHAYRAQTWSGRPTPVMRSPCVYVQSGSWHYCRHRARAFAVVTRTNSRLAFDLLRRGLPPRFLALGPGKVLAVLADAPASLRAIAIAWRRLLTSPPFPPEPALS